MDRNQIIKKHRNILNYLDLVKIYDGLFFLGRLVLATQVKNYAMRNIAYNLHFSMLN